MKVGKLEKIKKIFLFVILFWIVAHGYRFMNNLYTGDTLVEAFQDDIYWQRSLGRFMQPLTMIFRGTICAPWLLFSIAVVFFATGVFFVSEILEIENPLLLFIACGILSCNITITSTNAAFIPWIDVFAAAFLLAALGVWLFIRDKWWGYFLGITCFICSLGFYQAYIDVAFALFLILFLGGLAKGKVTKDFWIKQAKTGGGLLVSGIGYWSAYKLVLKIHHVEAADSYNSISEAGNYQGISINRLFLETYQKFFYYLSNPGSFVSTYLLGRSVSETWKLALKIALICIIICICPCMFYLNKRSKIPFHQIIMQIIAFLLLPFIFNAVCFISKGMEHELMIFSFFFLYIFLIFLIQELSSGNSSLKRLYIALIPLILLIWNNIVFSNQIYYKIEMEDRAALSFATRIVSSIESTDGYVAGVTPVLIVGSPEESDNVEKVEYLRDISILGNGNTPFTSYSSLPYYLKVYLGVRINICHENVSSDVIAGMPIYPDKNSIKYVDGILVIKLSGDVQSFKVP